MTATTLRLGLVGVLAAAACSPAPNILPTNDFNRPTDLAFMCLGAFGSGAAGDAEGSDGGSSTELHVSGRPMQACHPQGAASYPGDPNAIPPIPPGADPAASPTTRTFAFLPNSASGELSVIDADHWRIVDLDPASGAYGRLPLGSVPEQISVSDDGCRLVSANRGSCDLTLVDPSALLAPAFDAAYGGIAKPLPAPSTSRQVVVPHGADGVALGVAPFEVNFLPQDTTTLLGADNLCGSDGATAPTIGFSQAPTPSPWRALVTFPSCDLVALINLPGGDIVDSWKIAYSVGEAPTLGTHTGTSPTCPVKDCLGQPNSSSSGVTPPADAGTDADADGTTPDGGTAGTGGAAGTAGPGGAGGAAGTAGTGDVGGVGGAAGTASPGGAGGAGGAGGSGVAAAPTSLVRPAPIAIAPPDGPNSTTVRAYVGLSSAPFVLSLDLSSAGIAAAAAPDPLAIPLNETNAGTDRIRLAVNPYQYTTSQGIAGTFVGHLLGRQYLYVIARDGTLRVISVVPGEMRECETNIDPLSPVASPAAGCIPVDPVHRRPSTYRNPAGQPISGPGIRLPSIPVDVAAVDIRPGGANATSELTVGGAHAWVLTTSGTIYLVNIDPVLRSITVVDRDPSDPTKYIVRTEPEGFKDPGASEATVPAPYVNTLRDRNKLSYSTSLDPTSGPPRIPLVPGTSFTGPYVESFWAKGTRNNALSLGAVGSTVEGTPMTDFVPTSVYFRDPSAVIPQTWTITWQGALIGGRFTGNVDQTTGTTLKDGANFCSSGVLAGDLVTFTGCTDDTQCVSGFKCHRDPTVDQAAGGFQVTGLCVNPNDEAIPAGTECAGAFQTLRRYEITKAAQLSLELRPHLDELLFSSLTACETTTAASAPDGGAADGGATDGGNSDGGTAGLGASCADPTDPTGTAKFTCVAAPRGWGPPGKPAIRCLNKCTSPADCRSGRTCYQVPETDASGTPVDKDGNPTDKAHQSFVGYCADAPPLPQIKSCLKQLVTYNVTAGGDYLVSGSQTGLLVSGKTDAAGECVPLDPDQGDRDWRMVARIPITSNGVDDAKICSTVPANKLDSRTKPMTNDETAQPLSWLKTRPVVSDNPLKTEDPCIFSGGPNFSDGDLVSDPMHPLQHVRALFENPELSFVLTNVDREPPGGFTTSFDVAGGARPQYVQYPSTVEISMPARIVLGPIDSLSQTALPLAEFEAPYLFVVDQRRLGRSQGGGPTRGQLLRVNPVSFAATLGNKSGAQPIYEDYTRSGGLFPIQ